MRFARSLAAVLAAAALGGCASAPPKPLPTDLPPPEYEPPRAFDSGGAKPVATATPSAAPAAPPPAPAPAPAPANPPKP
jgi:hypothetical protein